MTNGYFNITGSAEEVYLWMSQTNIADDARKSLIFLAEESNKGLSADECAQLADQILFAVGRYELLLEQALLRPMREAALYNICPRRRKNSHSSPNL